MSRGSPFKHAKADDSAGFLLWKITTLWQRKLAEVLSEFGITQTQFALLASLRWFEEQQQPTSQTHLVDHTKIDKMTVSKSLRQLEAAGLVVREPSDLDSRATRIRFSARGKKLIQKAIVAIENADAAFFSCLNKKQLTVYKSLAVLIIGHNQG
ncbi:MAG: MarR family transcriptional regulator [Gammaproteobacteria bacterium]|nr:MarR family transcriptional regulator [Gammaproteobacteria bacterium]